MQAQQALRPERNARWPHKIHSMTLEELFFATRRDLRIIAKAARKLLAGRQRPRRCLDGIVAFERRITSQHGEDGILEELFKRIGATDKLFVEIGVEDGFECNAAHLVRRGWQGIMIEGDQRQFARLQKTYARHPGVKTCQAYVDRENVARIFANLSVPERFDLLSIDIDGNDYWIWQAVQKWIPRVVVIEFNAAYPPPARWVMRYNPAHHWNGTTYHGASLASLAALGAQLGYALIGTESSGSNAFFLRRGELANSGFSELTVETAYHAPQGSLFIPRLPWGFGPYEEL